MRFPRLILLPIVLSISTLFSFGAIPPSAAETKAKPAVAKETVNVTAVDALIAEQVSNENITGAVLAVGHDGHLIHEKAFGYRTTSPRREPMTVDTVFDLASLTKVVATAPSVMRLVQYGQVRLEDTVAHHIPEFGANGKESITLRQLLTHFSGLKPDFDLTPPWEGQATAFRMADELKPQ